MWCDKEVFLESGQACFKAARFCCWLIFFIAGHIFVATQLTFYEDFPCSDPFYSCSKYSSTFQQCIVDGYTLLAKKVITL